jgi:signal peptidase II
MKGYTKPLLIIFFVLLADQVLKTWIKTNMYLGQEFKIIGNWFIIHFTENNGLALGVVFGGVFVKMSIYFLIIAAVA